MIPNPTDNSDGASSHDPQIEEEWEGAPDDPPPQEHGTSQEVSRAETGEKRLLVYDESVSYTCWIDAGLDDVVDLEGTQ